MPYYLYNKSQIWNLNAILYWKSSQLVLGDINVEKLKNQLWGVLSYLHTKVSDGTSNPRVTQKMDNPLKGIQNSFP